MAQVTMPNEQEVLVRGSEEHQDYLQHQHGYIKEWVNGFETKLAISSRVLLLFYVIYITVRASVASALPSNPIVQYVLLGVDALMLSVQSMGLEGARPGLIHLAQEMESNGKTREAKKLMTSSSIVQWLMGATAVDIVLQAILVQTKSFHGFDLTALIDGYSYVLLIARVVAVGKYLGDMAKLSHRGPKIISQHEATKQVEEQEQKQIKIDNANILGVVEQAIAKWAQTQPDINASFSDSIRHLEEFVSRKLEATQATQNERVAALSRKVEAAQFGSTSSGPIDSETLTLQIEAMLSRSNSELKQSFESRISEVSRQVSRVEATTANQISELQSKNAKALSDAEARQQESLKLATAQTMPMMAVRTTQKEPVKPSQAKITDIAEAREERQSGLSLEEVKKLIESDESLLKLSGSGLAQKVGTSKATANRAKSEYVESHPGSTQNSDSGELEAVNL